MMQAKKIQTKRHRQKWYKQKRHSQKWHSKIRIFVFKWRTCI